VGDVPPGFNESSIHLPFVCLPNTSITHRITRYPPGAAILGAAILIISAVRAEAASPTFPDTCTSSISADSEGLPRKSCVAGVSAKDVGSTCSFHLSWTFHVQYSVIARTYKYWAPPEAFRTQRDRIHLRKMVVASPMYVIPPRLSHVSAQYPVPWCR
jgi:hypothetical protein